MVIVCVAYLNALAAWSAAPQHQAHGPLDGLIFEGKIGPKGHIDREDKLHFEDGKFWSEICVKCGFEPGDYWVRYEGDVLIFQGKLVGERGTFTYLGRIIDGVAEVSIDWRKERWYWTIEKEMAFSGRLTETAAPSSASQASKLAERVRKGETPPGCL